MTLVGVGYREPLSGLLSGTAPAVDCVEVIADRYLGDRGFTRAWELRRLVEFPVIVHGLSANTASMRGPSDNYLHQVRRLLDATGAIAYSDHAAMTAVAGRSLGHLAPNLFDDHLLGAATAHISRIVEITGARVCLENLATATTISGSDYTPEEFYLQLLSSAPQWDCLIDLTNLWINSTSRPSLDPAAFIQALPSDRIGYVHLAGGSRVDERWIDSHSEAVHPEVFDLLDLLLQKAAPVAVVIERDTNWARAEAELRADLDHVRELISRRRR